MGPARAAIRGVPGGRIGIALLLLFFLGVLPLLSSPAAAVTTVAIETPVGGELWSGGAAQPIVWDLTTDSNNDVDVEYLVDGTPILIERRLFVLPGRYTTSWVTPAQDLANVTVRVCATDAIPVECASSPAFAIDGAVPLLIGQSPLGSNAGLVEPVDVHFSEEMNRTRLEAAIIISPSPGNLSFAKLAGNGTRIHHPPFLPGRVYDVTLSCAATDLSDPGNSVPGCPISWSFRTATPPSIGMTSPVGGEVWSGGSSHLVQWTVADAEDAISMLNVSLERSPDGTTWTPIAGPLPGDASYPWAVPLEDGTVRLRALVEDTRGLNATAVSPPFAIDSTPPSVAGTIPAGGTVGTSWTEPIRVRFSEPVLGPLTAATFGLRDGAGVWVAGSLAWVSSTEFQFVPATHLRAFGTYTARVNGTVRDASDPGTPMSTPYEWTFATKPNNAPTIALSFAPGPVVTGGSTWTVSWIASDPDEDPSALSVYLEFSDGGAFSRVAGPLPAASTIAWTVPSADAATAALLVRVVDLHGGEATDAATFAIDATPPRVVTMDPPPGVTDTAPDAIVRVTLSEAVTGGPDFVGIRDVANQRWVDAILSWADDTTLLVRTVALLREMEAYEVVVNGTSRDRSVPGNFVEPTSWTFRIASFPPTLAVLSPAPNARWTAGSTQTIRVVAVDARDPTVNISADLAFDGSLFTPFVAAASVPGGTAAFPVGAPPIDAPNAVLRVCAADAGGATACTNVRIHIDAIRPRVAQSVPAGGAKQVHPDAPLMITFTEPMNPAAVESAFSLNPATSIAFRWARTSGDNDTVFVDHPRLLGLRTYVATIDCPARDASAPGLSIAGACPFAWTFTTAAAPEIHLLSPGIGERLSGGVVQPIRWVAAEEEGSVRVTVDLSVDGGVTFPFPLVAGEAFVPGDTRTERVFPSVSTATAVLRVRAEDSLGLAAETVSGPFSIDAVAPSLVSASPPNAAVDISPLADLVFVFSESMDPSTSYALAVAPAFRDAVLSWSATNVPFDTLTIQHSAVRLGTTVTVSFAGMRDASRPGNPIGGTVSFAVRPDRERPSAEIAIDAEATAGDVVVLDASGSSDNDEIIEYAWTVRDAGGRVVGRMRGERVEYRALKPGDFNVTVAVIDAAGNRGEASDVLRVHTLGTTVTTALPPAAPVLGWLALGAGGAFGYGFTDRGRAFLARTILMPLFIRIRPEKVLDQETRGMIRGYVLVHPGDSYTDIKRNLGLENGALAYHLGVLEREGIIRSVTNASRRAYYPAEMTVPEDGGGMHEVQGRLLRNVREVPGMGLRDLGGLVGISAQLALYHCRKLRDGGLVRLERHGVMLRVFPAGPGVPGSLRNRPT